MGWCEEARVPMSERYWTHVVASLTDQLRWYSQDVLLLWEYQLSRWEWPATCPIPRPQGMSIERLNGDRDYVLGQPLWHALRALTTLEARSCFLWVEGLKKTEAEWRAWWETEGQSFHEEMHQLFEALK